MASIARDPNGTKRILFTDGAGKRRTVRLGALPVKAAEHFKARVESLNSCRIAGTSPDAELSCWLRALRTACNF